MSLLLTWALVVHGVTQIVTVSRIARPIREAAPSSLRALLSCAMCFGFWVGFMLSLAGLGPVRQVVGWPVAASALLDGAASSAVAWAAHVVLARLGALGL
jgi:hypothetical protein